MREVLIRGNLSPEWERESAALKIFTIVFPGHMTVSGVMLCSSPAGIVSPPDMTDDSAMDDALADGSCYRLRMSHAFWQSGGFFAGLGRAGSTAGKDARRYAGTMRGTQGESSQIKVKNLKICPII